MIKLFRLAVWFAGIAFVLKCKKQCVQPKLKNDDLCSSQQPPVVCHPSEEEHRTAEQANWRQTNAINKGIALVACIAAVFAYLTYQETKRQADAAAASLIQVSRAWINVTIEDASVLIDWTNPKPIIVADITSKNVGGTPAIGELAYATLLLPFGGSQEDIRREVELHCSAVKGYGNILFMNEARTVTVRVTNDDNDITDMVESLVAVAPKGGTFETELRIEVCARYKIVGSDEIHHTARLFAITDIGKGKPVKVRYGARLEKGTVYLRSELQGELAD